MAKRTKSSTDSSSRIKSVQLGEPVGTANCRLRKMVMFELVKACGKDICHRCGKKIETVDTFSLDHKVAWLYSSDPVGLFYDLTNIAFSHPRCNYDAARCASVVRAGSGYKGVYHDKSGKRAKPFRSEVCYKRDGKTATLRLGWFETAEEAARAYDAAAVLKFGERAVTNESMGLLKPTCSMMGG